MQLASLSIPYNYTFLYDEIVHVLQQLEVERKDSKRLCYAKFANYKTAGKKMTWNINIFSNTWNLKGQEDRG